MSSIKVGIASASSSEQAFAIASCVERLWPFEQDPLMLVGFDLPFVGRVRLSDINDKELDLVSEAATKRFKVLFFKVGRVWRISRDHLTRLLKKRNNGPVLP